MIRNFINNIKLNRLSYLLEVIEVRDFKSKINAYNKIKRMKITKEMGLLILDDSNFAHENNYSDFNISLSLISLLFEDYQDEYSEKIYEIFPNLTNESKYEVLNMLSCTNNLSAVSLYKDLVIKYYKLFDIIPIGTLYKYPDNYYYLFPSLFKVFNNKYKNTNNLVMLLSDFINLGVVLEKDIKKNKKVIQEEVKRILKDAVKYKYPKDNSFMQDRKYISLRMYLESAINIEYYVSDKETTSYLESLYKKKDNQIKLFILDNYVRKGMDVSKYNFNSIARDNLSRYPLYSFLKFYGLEKHMPKKYAKNKLLAESDLFINYCNSCSYSSIPYDFKLVDEDVINGYKYYSFDFKTKYNYYEEITDAATDYILKNTSIDKEMLENSEIEYYGISGGFNTESEPSLIDNPLKDLYVFRKDDLYSYDITNLLPKTASKTNKSSIKNKMLTGLSIFSLSKIKSKLPKKIKKKETDITVDENVKDNKKAKVLSILTLSKLRSKLAKKKEEKKLLKEQQTSVEETNIENEQQEIKKDEPIVKVNDEVKEKKISKVLSILTLSKLRSKLAKKKEEKKLLKEQQTSVEETNIENEQQEIETEEQNIEIDKEVEFNNDYEEDYDDKSIFTNYVLKRNEKKKSKKTEEEIVNYSILKRIFSFNTLLILIFIIFVVSFVVLLSILFDFDIFGLKKDSSLFNTKTITPCELTSDKFNEIKYTEIFNRDKKEYYVLFFSKKKTSTYYNYINPMLENNYIVYYVDLSKEENKAIYQGNSTGFVISSDTFLKVNEAEYEFYVVGKTNILNEMKTYLEEINQKKADEAIKNAEEQAKKAAEEKKKQEEAEKKKAESILKSIDEQTKSKLENNNSSIQSSSSKSADDIIKSVEEDATKKSNNKKKSE